MWKLFRFLGKKWQNGPKQRRREVETVSSLKHIPSQFWKESENEGTPLPKLNLDTLPKQTHILYISLISFDQQKLVDLQKVKVRQFFTLRAWCKKILATLGSDQMSPFKASHWVADWGVLSENQLIDLQAYASQESWCSGRELWSGGFGASWLWPLWLCQLDERPLFVGAGKETKSELSC